MRNPLKPLSSLYSIVAIVPLTLFFWAIMIFLRPFDLLSREKCRQEGRLPAGGRWVRRIWCRGVLVSHGIRLVAEGPGLGVAKQLRGVIYVANHQSTLDIPTLVSVVSEDSAFLAKQELRKIPFFGWAAEAIGTLFIDRSQGARSTSLQELNDLIKKGVSVLMFPEGTRSKDGNILPFKRGAFVTAIQNQAPVVPIGISGSGLCGPRDRLYLQSGVIKVVVGMPISTQGMTTDQRGELADRVQSLIVKMVEK